MKRDRLLLRAEVWRYNSLAKAWPRDRVQFRGRMEEPRALLLRFDSLHLSFGKIDAQWPGDGSRHRA